MQAKVIIATAIFKFFDGEESTKVLKMSAVGKYPFLTISSEKFDFETLLVGKTSQKQILLKNESLVPANFLIQKSEHSSPDSSFSLDHYSGTVPPNSSFIITVKYVPGIVGVTSCSNYQVTVLGGNSHEFTLKGYAEGYDVSLSNRSIHFGEV